MTVKKNEISKILQNLPSWVKTLLLCFASLGGGYTSASTFVQPPDNPKYEQMLDIQANKIDSIEKEVIKIKANNDYVWLKLEDIYEAEKETRSDVKDIANYIREHK